MPRDAFHFRLDARSGLARAGHFTTPHGGFATPAFMPVGTHGALKALTPDQVRAAGAEIVLANTYHLAQRPGEALVAKLGGLHAFMRWSGPILTDSGGFQVFSLPKKEITDRGVRFKNELDGSEMDLTPERAIEIQHALGADIVMAFDECTPYPADEALARTGVRRTLAWLERCLAAHAGHEGAQALFGIVQGSVYPELRRECAQAVAALGLPGIAIGGVSVGEGHELLCRITRDTAPLLPEDRPRYLMGVGLPEDIARRDRLRHRHVRLRDPDAPRARRRRLHRARAHPAHEPPLPPRRLPDRHVLRLRRLRRRLLARLPAPPVRRQRDALGGAGVDPQRTLL